MSFPKGIKYLEDYEHSKGLNFDCILMKDFMHMKKDLAHFDMKKQMITLMQNGM